MKSLRLGLVSTLLVTSVGCGPHKSSDGEGGNSEGSSSESSSEAGQTTGATSSGGSATGGSSGVETSETGSTGGGGESCPPSTGAGGGFSLAGVDEWAEVSIDITCTLAAIAHPAEGADELTLTDCVDDASDPVDDAVLTITTSPYSPAMVEEGGRLRLRYEGVPPFYSGRWLTLRSDPGNTLLVAGIDGPGLQPWSGDLGYSPLEIGVEEGSCELTPDVTGCGDAERVALGVGYDDTVTVVFDGTSGFVGQLTSYAVLVSRAVLWRDVVCDDFPEAAFGAVFVMIPEG